MSLIEASPCDHPRLLGPSRYESKAERDWYERHEPWIWAQLEHGTTRWADEPTFMVNVALDLLWENAAERGAEPRWEELDVRELLLERLPMGGILDTFGSRDLLLGLKEFIAWLGEQGKLDPALAARQQAAVDACQEAFLDIFGDTEPKEQPESLEDLINNTEKNGETWLSCLHCNRVFQAKSLVVDFLGNRQGCPFTDCGAAGLGVDILPWDTFKNNRDPRWPKTEAELRHGQTLPE